MFLSVCVGVRRGCTAAAVAVFNFNDKNKKSLFKAYQKKLFANFFSGDMRKVNVENGLNIKRRV